MKPNGLKLLFLARTYPPLIGGMENFSYHLINSIAGLKKAEVTAIVNKKGRSFLPLFLLLLVPKLIFSARKYSLIHLADGVLAPIGEIIKLIFPKKKVVCTIHGLDITYAEKNSFYKKFNLQALSSLDKIIAVSEATKKTAIRLKVPEDKIVVIANGVNPPPKEKKNGQEMFWSLIRKRFPQLSLEELENKNFILTIGRLCKRKGVAWFIEKVFPALNKDTIYLIAGGGPERLNLEKIIESLNLNKRVLLLGTVTEEEKSALLSEALLFIQPNIKVKGDMEGFGISMLEASVNKIPVIASRIEGIKQAIIHKKNGFLIKSRDSQKFTDLINRLIENKEERKLLGEKFQKFTLENFSWDKIAREYLAEFEKISEENEDQNHLIPKS